MSRWRVVGLLVLLAVASSHAAEATTFTLQSYTVAAQGRSGAMPFWTKNLLPAPTSFQLTTVGQAYTTSLFRIGTRQSTVTSTQQRRIGVTFGFSQPMPAYGGVVQGVAGAIQLLGGLGYVAWANPITLSFGTTGLLQVSLTHAIFGTPGFAIVGAKFKLLRQNAGGSSPTQVPEPATILLLAAGVVGFAGRRVRQIRRRPTSV